MVVKYAVDASLYRIAGDVLFAICCLTYGNIEEIFAAVVHYFLQVGHREKEDHLMRAIVEDPRLAKTKKTEIVSIADALRARGMASGRKKGLKEGMQKGIQKGREKGREEGREEGREKGRKEGWQAARKTMVQNCLSKRMQLSEIAELTGLTVVDIEKLSSEIA